MRARLLGERAVRPPEEKELLALRKKLRDVARLAAQQARGAALQANQLQKLARKADFEAQARARLLSRQVASCDGILQAATRQGECS